MIPPAAQTNACAGEGGSSRGRLTSGLLSIFVILTMPVPRIIAAIKDRVGGIMFWAANEAAVSSLNGKTTGENSGTLAAFAAELVA